MSKFAPPKAKRPSNLWASLPTTKATSTLTTNAITRAISPKINTTTNPTMTSTCGTCKKWGPPCPFCVQSTPHPSPVESHWSDEDWNRDKQREKEKRKHEQQAQQKKEDLTKDYCLPSCMTQCLNQDPLPHCTPKEKLALDLN